MGRMGEQLEQEKPLLSRRSKIWICAALLFLLLFSIALFLLKDSIGRTLMMGEHSELQTPRNVTIGIDALTIEDNTIRFERQRHNGPASRVDLALMWPEMRGYSLKDRQRFDDPTQTDALIFIEITQSTMSRDMSGRIAPIYSQLFDGPPAAAPYGLTAHHLRPGSGYDGEVLYTAPRSGNTDYAVRCLVDDTPRKPSIDNCQRDIHIGKDLSVLYRFSGKNLKDWQNIETAVISYINHRLGTH